MAEVAGLLLAAGAGRRFGGPKALAVLDGEPFVVRSLRVLAEAGCVPVRVVLGASAAQARALLPDPGAAVVAEDWESGMGASLRAGLRVLAETDAEAAVVHLVDLPGVGAEVVRRVAAGADGNTVARAAYDGVPGHPVVLGRRWWPEIVAGASGDKGARDWLRAREDLRLVECGDLGTGQDVDRREDLPG
ncbi:nucleotidyltransferase family protein [Amycolatopsis keratiniphila]|uniref:Molybdopterin-guanine dinucleotide biosynthesis protein MobA n=1 Tax=Amycolatopsis keratiniphila subsp. keratiniphila TaxID=227715 RepID=A0A1W2LYY0_9PSEU|nr:nucleotidyltransferase family protein [Amycolatopsis keratiniphila]ONF72437.1 molybdopterin-guanine dinucleotide biosynthesis protein MobA [Amycolatopsis keratiniphila subsp. keratiniphila]